MNLKELYQEIILDHGKNPRNLRNQKKSEKSQTSKKIRENHRKSEKIQEIRTGVRAVVVAVRLSLTPTRGSPWQGWLQALALHCRFLLPREFERSSKAFQRFPRDFVRIRTDFLDFLGFTMAYATDVDFGRAQVGDKSANIHFVRHILRGQGSHGDHRRHSGLEVGCTEGQFGFLCLSRVASAGIAKRNRYVRKKGAV